MLHRDSQWGTRKEKKRERKPAGETRQPSVLENDRSESKNKWEDLILGAHLEIIKGDYRYICLLKRQIR